MINVFFFVPVFREFFFSLPHKSGRNVNWRIPLWNIWGLSAPKKNLNIPRNVWNYFIILMYAQKWVSNWNFQLKRMSRPSRFVWRHKNPANRSSFASQKSFGSLTLIKTGRKKKCKYRNVGFYHYNALENYPMWIIIQFSKYLKCSRAPQRDEGSEFCNFIILIFSWNLGFITECFLCSIVRNFIPVANTLLNREKVGQ